MSLGQEIFFLAKSVLDCVSSFSGGKLWSALFRLVLQVSTAHPSSPICSFETANSWWQKPPIPSFSFRRFQTFCHFTILLIFFSFKEFLLGLILCYWNLEVLSAKVVNLQNLHENSGCWCRVCVLICAEDWILSQLCGFHLYPMVFIGWVCPGIMTTLICKFRKKKLEALNWYHKPPIHHLPFLSSPLRRFEIVALSPISSHTSPLAPLFHCLSLNFLTDWSKTCFLLLVWDE